MATLSAERGQSELAALNKAEEVFQLLQESSPSHPVMKKVPVLPDIVDTPLAEVEAAEKGFSERAGEWLASIGRVLTDSEHLLIQLEEIFGRPKRALALLSEGGKCAADSLSHLLGKRGLETEVVDMMSMLEELAAVVSAQDEGSETVPQLIMEALCKDAVENVKSLGETLPPGLQDKFLADLFLLIEKCNSESELLTGITLQIAGMWSSLDSNEVQDLKSPSRRLARTAAELLEAAAIVTQRSSPRIQTRPERLENCTAARGEAQGGGWRCTPVEMEHSEVAAPLRRGSVIGTSAKLEAKLKRRTNRRRSNHDEFFQLPHHLRELPLRDSEESTDSNPTTQFGVGAPRRHSLPLGESSWEGSTCLTVPVDVRRRHGHVRQSSEHRLGPLDAAVLPRAQFNFQPPMRGHQSGLPGLPPASTSIREEHKERLQQRRHSFTVNPPHQPLQARRSSVPMPSIQ